MFICNLIKSFAFVPYSSNYINVALSTPLGCQQSDILLMMMVDDDIGPKKGSSVYKDMRTQSAPGIGHSPAIKSCKANSKFCRIEVSGERCGS